MGRSRVTARLAALAAVVMWGISFVASKAALRQLTPITLLFSRFGLGVIVLFILLGVRRQRLVPPRGTWPMLVLMGFDGVFLHHMIQLHGLNMTTAVRTGWLIGLIPIWSAALAAIFLHEGFGPRKIVGLVLGTVGAVLVITRGDLSPRVLALPSTRGDLLVLASTVNWAIYTILGRQTLKRLGSARATAAGMFVGWAMYMPFFAGAGGWSEYGSMSAATVVAVLFLGIGCSALAYLFWYAALQRLEASQVSAFLHLEPLVTLAAAVSMLGEPVTLSTIIGGMLVLAGVATVQTGGSRAPETARDASRVVS